MLVFISTTFTKNPTYATADKDVFIMQYSVPQLRVAFIRNSLGSMRKISFFLFFLIYEIEFRVLVLGLDFEVQMVKGLVNAAESWSLYQFVNHIAAISTLTFWEASLSNQINCLYRVVNKSRQISVPILEFYWLMLLFMNLPWLLFGFHYSLLLYIGYILIKFCSSD